MDQFCCIWFQKWTKNGLFLCQFWPHSCKKVSIFEAKFSKTGWRCKAIGSVIILLHGSTSELRIWELSYWDKSNAIRALVLLSRTTIVTTHCQSAMYFDASTHQIRHSHTWILTLKGSIIKFTQFERKSLFTGEIIGSKFIKNQNMLMTLCHQKVTKQRRMYQFMTRLIENSVLAIFTHSEKFATTKRYYKATAPISTVLFTLSDKMTQRHGIVPKHR